MQQQQQQQQPQQQSIFDVSKMAHDYRYGFRILLYT